MTAPEPAAALTQADLEAGLRRLGLAAGDAVEVHSSLRSLGWVEGGADTLIAALIAVVGPRGAIVMSAYRVSAALPLTAEDVARGLAWKVRRYPPGGRERTGLGVVADTFSYRPDVVCGTGLHRVCVWGHDAEALSRGYRQLLAVDGRVLLVGVGIDRCSSMHLAEESVPVPEAIRRRLAVPPEVLRHYPADEWSVGVAGPAADPWLKVWEEALCRGIVQQGPVGHTVCSLFSARAMVAIHEECRRRDPYGFYGMAADGAR
jgi:aminoglycoside 3-N-acetyltransferase